MIYERCRDILLREFELVQNAVLVQEKISAAVTGKEWADFEENLSTFNSIESKLAELENEREKLFNVYETIIHQKSFSENLDAKGRFYSLVSMLPESQRNELTEIYRGLKVEAIKLQIANSSLLSYLAGIKSTLNEFFALAFPERGGKMYTKTGTHSSQDLRSMVLNTSF